MTNVATLSLNTSSNKWEAVFQNKVVASSPNKHYTKTKAKAAGYDAREVEAPAMGSLTIEPLVPQFGINERFDFLSEFVAMVEDGTSASLLVTGEGGLGKTYTVNQALVAAGREMLHLEAIQVDEEDEYVIDDSKFYTVIKGYSTAKGLYRALYENRNRVIVFDDCDTVLKDPVALNLLKGALDSYDRRIISWNAEMSEKDNLPRSFEFRGGVIFISNMEISKVDQAIRSRAICIDLSMTTQQKIDRMEVLIAADGFLPDYSLAVKRTALKFLAEMQDRARELSLRTLIQVIKVADRGNDWQRRAEYLLTAV
jgi:hypothetical protein